MLSKLTVSVMKNRFAFWLLGAGAALTLLAGPAHAAQEFRLSLKGLQVAAPGSPSQGGATPPEPVLAPGALSASTVAFGDVVLDSTVLRTAVVSNSGQSSLSGVHLVNASLPPNVSVVSNECGTALAPISLTAGASCAVNLRWAPSDAGQPLGSLDFASLEGSSVNVAFEGAAYPVTGVRAWLNFDSFPFGDTQGNVVTTVGLPGSLSNSAAVGAGAASLASGGYSLPLSASDFKSSDFTVEVWVKPTANRNEAIFSRDNNENVNWGNALFAHSADGKVYAYCNPSAMHVTRNISATTGVAGFTNNGGLQMVVIGLFHK